MGQMNFAFVQFPKDLSVSVQTVLIGAKSLHTHGSAGVKLASRNSHFRTKAEQVSVRKTSRAVGENIRAVHFRHETFHVSIVRADDGVRVVGTVAVDVRDGFFQTVYHPNRKNRIQVFRFPVRLLGCLAV